MVLIPLLVLLYSNYLPKYYYYDTNHVALGGLCLQLCGSLFLVVSQVGFKPAGGIRTAQESLMWLVLMKEELGPDWLRPHLFRLGASSLLADIERQVGHHEPCHKRYFDLL